MASAAETVQFGDPGADGGGAAAESVHDALQDLAACDDGFGYGGCGGDGTDAGDVLEVVAHGFDDGAEDVYGECTEWEGGDAGVQMQGDVETEEAA